MKLWTGFTIARVGSQITVLALPLTAVLLLGAGATETGLLVAAQMAPSIVAGLFIGVWVDRLPRRPIMIVSDIGSAIVIATVPPAAALGTLSLAQLYVVSFLGGAFAVATDLARAAFVPSLVGRTRLVAANSRLQASNAVAQVAGPSLGGILVQAHTAPIAMLWDAVGFLVSAVFIAAIRSTETPRPRETARSVWQEVTEGLRWVRGQPIVLRSITAIALANIEWFAVQGVLVVYATRELGLSPALLGISLAMIGPLSLLGAALAARSCTSAAPPSADISTPCRNPRLRSDTPPAEAQTQRVAPQLCSHLRKARDHRPNTPNGCEECLASGDSWVHLRLCLECGHVGCCDDSPNKHATKHYRATSHPVIRSFEPGERWRYCYPDDLFVE